MAAEEAVAVVGLGSMGGAMTTALLAAGREVYGFDIDRSRCDFFAERGMNSADDLAGLAANADVIITSLATGEQLATVVDELAAARPDLLVVDTSTLHPEDSAAVARQLESAGSSLLRAAVSGSDELARTGSLAIFCSGRESDYTRVKPLLDVLGKEHVYVGAEEEARVMKLLVNLVVAGTMGLVSETLRLGEASGLARLQVLEALQSSVIGSPYIAYKSPALAARDYRPTASVDIALKDLGLVSRMAADAGVVVPLADGAKKIYADAAAAGFGDRDHSIVAELGDGARSPSPSSTSGV